MCWWWLYIVRFLHQTTTGATFAKAVESCISSVSYIKPQLVGEHYGPFDSCISSVSYIKPQLIWSNLIHNDSCISSVSYIKPQLCSNTFRDGSRCISSVSYIKPQHTLYDACQYNVVYRPFPTSNHNFFRLPSIITLLYIVRFLHQTTTSAFWDAERAALYIVRFLHQTTTCTQKDRLRESCISSVSYIKPQQIKHYLWSCKVVYRPFPTSNHNYKSFIPRLDLLYIVRFLHQTTTLRNTHRLGISCISSVSYIKPQPSAWCWRVALVVYRPFPTSNHNRISTRSPSRLVVYRPFPTSNHNAKHDAQLHLEVVYRPFPTSNHNLRAWALRQPFVVYRPFPTSNHNL